MKARKRVVQGGTSAGKTYAIIPVLINRALSEPRLKITIVAESIPAVKDGAVDIFKEVMFDTGRWVEISWIQNPLEYKFGNGSRIQFKSFDTIGKAKSAGKRDILFINEANNIPFPIADALMIRSKETYIDYNPDNEFWAHTEVLAEPNSEFLLLTYADNEAIPSETLEDMLIKKSKAFHDPDASEDTLFDAENIKSEYWANWWRVYGLGLVGQLEGVIFNNWKEIETIPPQAKKIGYGMDFGYTNDPTTLTAIYELDDEIYLDELIYQTGLTNPQIYKVAISAGYKKDAITYADSADPKSIKELKDHGMKITGADKGTDSIKFGIQKMQEKTLYITKRSRNLKEELINYKWAKDKQGNSLNEPIDTFNHCIDGIRYYFNSTKKKMKAPKARYS